MSDWLHGIEIDCEFNINFNTQNRLPVDKRYKREKRMARVIRELAKYAKFLEAYVESDMLQTERRAANLSPDAKELLEQ